MSVVVVGGNEKWCDSKYIFKIEPILSTELCDGVDVDGLIPCFWLEQLQEWMSLTGLGRHVREAVFGIKSSVSNMLSYNKYSISMSR